MRSASRKPRVVTSSVGSPLRSSSALVATVVPIFTHSTCSGVIGSSGARPSRRRMPATAASRYCSGFSDSSLCVDERAVGALADDVGEGAAAVDPELPAARGRVSVAHRAVRRRSATAIRVVMSCTGSPVARAHGLGVGRHVGAFEDDRARARDGARPGAAPRRRSPRSASVGVELGAIVEQGRAGTRESGARPSTGVSARGAGARAGAPASATPRRR